MRISIAVLLITGITLSGCSSWQGSKVNPTNWFGKSESSEVAAGVRAGEVNPLIPENSDTGLFSKHSGPPVDISLPVASVTELRIEQTPSGAIIYASGLATRQGAHEVRLKRNEDTDDSTLELSFGAVYPEFATPEGSELSRTLRVAASLTHQDLAGVRLIRVTSKTNARETRR